MTDEQRRILLNFQFGLESRMEAARAKARYWHEAAKNSETHFLQHCASIRFKGALCEIRSIAADLRMVKRVLAQPPRKESPR